MRFVLGLDEAKVRDWSALSAVGVEIAQGTNMYSLVGISKKQGLPYDQIVDWVVSQFKKPVFNIGVSHPPVLVMDNTGVGVAVYDLFVKAGMTPQAITITSGSNFTVDQNFINLGKARLIGTFLAAYDSGRIKVNPNLPAWPLLEKEMLSFRGEPSSSGNIKFNSVEGSHDDMLFSFALAIWYGEEMLGSKKTLVEFPNITKAITGGSLLWDGLTLRSPKQQMVARRLFNEIRDSELRR